jgi:ribosomal protein S18 acetylase RimI-like enzyme
MEKTLPRLNEKLLAQVNIRYLKAEDLPSLEWDGEYTHFRRVYEQAFWRARNGLSVLWVVELDGVGIIGQVFIQLRCDQPELADGVQRAYLYSFRIKSPYRCHGLGSSMLRFVENDLHNRKFRYITLNVAKDNFRALALYQRHGYKVIAHEPGVWSYIDDLGHFCEKAEPAWRMEKFIAKS